jgi:anti-anti-sigma factor
MPWSARHNHLRFALEHDQSSASVRLAGELDYASAAVAHLALERAGPDVPEITLDLSRVVFLDATGVRFLISAQRRARAAGRRLIIRHPSRSVRRMLDLTGAGPLLAIDDGDDSRPDDPGRPELARILDTAMQRAMRIALADRSTAQLRDSTTREWRIVAHHGFSPAFVEYLKPLSDADSVFAIALRRGRTLWISDAARSAILAETPVLDALLDTGVRAMAVLPIKGVEGMVAALSLHHRLPTKWTPEQKNELERLGRSVTKQYLALRLRFAVTGAAAL